MILCGKNLQTNTKCLLTLLPHTVQTDQKREYYIDRLSGYIASSGKKYENHAATIRRWAADDKEKEKPKKGIPDYSYKEGESL